MHDMYHSDENYDKGLLGCDYWKTGRQVPTFWRVMALLPYAQSMKAARCW